MTNETCSHTRGLNENRECYECAHDAMEFELQKVRVNLAVEQVDHRHMQALLIAERDAVPDDSTALDAVKMRVAEAVREACADCCDHDEGSTGRLRELDLAAIVDMVKP